jgi:transposase
MKITPESLPNSIGKLKKMVLSLVQDHDTFTKKVSDEKCQLIAERDAFETKYNRLLEQLKVSNLKRFGQSSETSEQMALFDEADTPLPPETKATIALPEKTDRQNKAKPKKRNRRVQLPDHLPVEEIIHDVDEADKTCACGHARHRIGEEVSDQLKYIPAKLVIVRHIRPKYGCRACEDGITIAPMPMLLLPKSIATPELVAQTILAKYEDHIPLYRQEKQWERLGIDLPRNSCCAWIMKTTDYCEPLYELLAEDVLASNYVQGDETPVLVLKTKDAKKRKKAYMWCYRSHPPNGPSAVYFEYQPTRSGKHAQAFLKTFEGYFQSDMYNGYDFLAKKENVIHVGCMAHARRRFADIVKVHKKPGLAHQAMKFFKALYKIERRIKTDSIDQRYAVRQARSKHVLNQFRKWLEKSIQHVPDGFAIGKAIHYCLTHWEKLTNYTKDGRLHIDNNLVENNIRPFALGRKNWQFKGSPRGAKAGAILYSLLATCKANQINPEKYLVKMLSNIRACRTPDDFRKLLPYHIEL